jgi:aerobic-type carbon monoxide dehydrogenase small subunit (CoxS/CutS family)
MNGHLAQFQAVMSIAVEVEKQIHAEVVVAIDEHVAIMFDGTKVPHCEIGCKACFMSIDGRSRPACFVCPHRALFPPTPPKHAYS